LVFLVTQFASAAFNIFVPPKPTRLCVDSCVLSAIPTDLSRVACLILRRCRFPEPVSFARRREFQNFFEKTSIVPRHLSMA